MSHREPQPWDTPVSLVLWTVSLTWLAVWLPVLTLLHRWWSVDTLDGLTRVYTRGQVALTGSRWRAVVHPEVRPDVPYLFVQNHVNILDHVTMYDATPHLKQGIELQSHFDVPVYGPFMRARGTLPVTPGSPRTMLDLRRRMRETLERGHSLLAFPEGTRTRTGRVGPFKEGIFHLARQLGVPVVPVAVTGMWEVLPTPGRTMRPMQQVTVHVLAPHPTDGLSRTDVPAFAERVRAEIAEIVDAHAAVQEAA